MGRPRLLRRHGRRFHIHGVTGPDEYTTVVNDNTYTNLMARANLRVRGRRGAPAARPSSPQALRRAGCDAEARARRARAAGSAPPTRCTSRTTRPAASTPQDDSFLDREVWDLDNTPPDKFPLLLHYHPLVIYRHQVLKQADVVLAMFLLGDEFSAEQKRRNFDYYDPLTTGDSSLSACIQSIVAAEMGDGSRRPASTSATRC